MISGGEGTLKPSEDGFYIRETYLYKTFTDYWQQKKKEIEG